MALQFYNTLNRRLEEFDPPDPSWVGIYACGPTVYQSPHIGNYRTFLFNDLLHRYLRWKGYSVKFVMNLTDVDDKTIAGAAEESISLEEFTDPKIRGFFQDLDVLGVERAAAYPRATHHMQRMVALVERLLEKGHAYLADGAVYFDISSFEDYGKLSGVDPASVRAAERTRQTADEYAKEDARDFVLWKAAGSSDRQVGAVWPAPWGEGRPGWHLECSAMSMAELGETFDIHTGGEDLVFPHHEDEIAQSEAATGRPFARYWLHVKHLLVEGEKMSKSRGNFFTLRDLLDQGHEPAAIRYLLLAAHYRKELNFTIAGLKDARAALQRIIDFVVRLEEMPVDRGAAATELPELAETFLARFEASLDDDLNMPAALGALFTFVREGNGMLAGVTELTERDREAALGSLARMDEVLGCVGLARAWRENGDQELALWVEDRLRRRDVARAERDFQEADRIRAELAGRGIVVEDTPKGPRWRLR